MTLPSNVAFCGGGSGGHLVPAMAIAEELAAGNGETQFSFLTSSREIDRRVLQTLTVDQQRWRQVLLPVTSSSARMRYAIAVARSFLRCRSEFRRSRPDIAIGLGGFASVPGILAAVWLKIPIALLETNTIPGGANRFLSRHARATFFGWPISDQHRREWKSPICDVGVPVRRGIRELVASASISPPTLLIIGGSQGASSVNQLVHGALVENPNALQGWHVVHQTGTADVPRFRKLYEQYSTPAIVLSFLDDLPQRIADSQLVISRCGAVTLAEIAALRRPSILIPLSTSADQHQLANARIFEQVGAACVIDESQPDAATGLSQALAQLCQSAQSGQLRDTMSAAVGTLSDGDAAARIVEELDRLL